MKVLSVLFLLFTASNLWAFRPTLSFWQGGIRPVAVIDSTGLFPLADYRLHQRNLPIRGNGIYSYKAIVINSGLCSDAQHITALESATETSILFPFFFTPPAETLVANFTVCAKGKNYSGIWQDASSPSFSSTLTIYTQRPVVDSLAINNGTTSTLNNTVTISYQASDANLNITHFCLKTTSGVNVPSAPITTDNCWQPVNNPSPGVSPSPNITFNNYNFTLGYTSAIYQVYAWAKNSVENISTLSNSGNGTTSTDKAAINYIQGSPPTLVNIVATNSDSPSSPPAATEQTIAQGQDVYIKWKATDSDPLPSNPIQLYYTLDDSTFTLISANLINGVNGDCTVDGVNHTGCYKWSGGSPTANYFRIRVAATDSSSMTTFSSSSPLNTNNFRFLAGNTEAGIGSSAVSGVISNYVNDMETDVHSLVVTPSGKFFIKDRIQGILSIDPVDGILNKIIPITGVSTDGAIGVATLKSANAKIILDYEGNIIIHEIDRIRKFNLTTNTISTIIGGGTLTDSGILATQLKIDCDYRGTNCPLQVLPNNDIYFFRSKGISVTNDNTLYRYDSEENKVYSILPSGTVPQYSSTAAFNISTALFSHFGIEFDPSNSSIQRFFGHFRRNPCTGCGNGFSAAQLDTSTWNSYGTGYNAVGTVTTDPHSFINSMDGQLYSITEYNNSRSLWRLNRGSTNWTRVLGVGAVGSCVDGTSALSCNVYLQDAFVTAQGKIFFLDNGLVRTIDENNNVLTLFGQRRTFGDDGNALSARFNSIQSIDYTSDGKVVILDDLENVLREVTIGGNVVKLADNISGGYWGARYQIYVDRGNNENDIFYTGNGIFRWDRSDNTHTKVIGGGATPYPSADGLSGLSVRAYYPIQLLGFDGTKLIGSFIKYDNAVTTDASFNTRQWKFFDKTDSYRQSHFTGVGETPVLPVGQPVATSATYAGPVAQRGYWDASTSTWYFIAGENSNTIKALPIGGNISTFATVPDWMTSWTMTKNASGQWILYYCSGGKIYKYNQSTSLKTALAWPISSISCSGRSIYRDSNRNSLVFPYTQNGLVGIAEIIDTP